MILSSYNWIAYLILWCCFSVQASVNGERNVSVVLQMQNNPLYKKRFVRIISINMNYADKKTTDFV